MTKLIYFSVLIICLIGAAIENPVFGIGIVVWFYFLYKLGRWIEDKTGL